MQGAGAGPWGCSSSSAQAFGEPGSHLGWAVGPGGCSALQEGERAEVKITPWAGSGPCGFLQFTALPGGRGGRNLPGSELALTLSPPTEEAPGPFLAAGTLGKGGSRGAPALELGSASPGQVEGEKVVGWVSFHPPAPHTKGVRGGQGGHHPKRRQRLLLPAPEGQRVVGSPALNQDPIGRQKGLERSWGCRRRGVNAGCAGFGVHRLWEQGPQCQRGAGTRPPC